MKATAKATPLAGALRLMRACAVGLRRARRRVPGPNCPVAAPRLPGEIRNHLPAQQPLSSAELARHIMWPL